MAVFSSSKQLLAMEQLPPDIMLDIISRLPAASVIRCKCVCRSWRTLLNNHHFSGMHLQKQITSRSSRFDFLVRYKPDKYGVRGKEFQSLEYKNHDNDGDDDYQVSKVDHHLMIKYQNHQQHIFPEDYYFAIPVGSCNGLVCLACFNDPTHICNPVTREYINLPIHDRYHEARLYYSLPAERNPLLAARGRLNNTIPSTITRIVSGFGYHPRTYEYKVVRIYYDDRSGDRQGQVEVYTVGKDCGRWRNKGTISHRLPQMQRGVLVHGTLYWKASLPESWHDGIGHLGLQLVGFDLAEEEFYAVENIPKEWYSYKLCSIIIRELGGFLYLFSVYPSTAVWVMKNSTRNNESWVKEYSISENWRCLDPFTITKSGELLAWYNHCNSGHPFLVRYNPKTGNVKPCEDHRNAKLIPSIIYGAVPYIKSFVSLKDLGEEDAIRVGRSTEGKDELKRKASSCLKCNVFSEKQAKLDGKKKAKLNDA